MPTERKERNVTPKVIIKTKDKKEVEISSLFKGNLQEFSVVMRDQLIMAEVLAKSQAIPMHYIGKPAAVFAAIQWGRELGVPPMISVLNMFNVKGKTATSTILLYGLVCKRPDFRGMIKKSPKPKEECTVIVRRAIKIGETEEIVEYDGTFSMEDARLADLVKLGSAWTAYPKRMLFNRALSFALRDAFPDVLAGVYTYEELKGSISVQEMEETTL